MTTSPTIESATTTWPVSKLRPNQLNPRSAIKENGIEELTASIRAQGVLQPLLVTPAGVVVAGHRRLEAAKRARLEHVPVIVRELNRDEQLEIMLVENLQREDLSPVEEAKAFRALLDAGYTTAELARRLGVNTIRIHTRVQLLKLDEQVQWAFHRGDLPLTLAPVLARVPDPGQQRRMATQAASRRLTVAELERIVERGTGALRSAPSSTSSKGALPSREDGDTDGLSRARVEMLKLLEGRGGDQVSLSELAGAFRETCCACGMEDLPNYCAACPMLDLVQRLVGRNG